MTYYRLYFLNDQSRFSDVLELTCSDDVAACAEAADKSDGRAMELWERSRMVARLDGRGERLADLAPTG